MTFRYTKLAAPAVCAAVALAGCAQQLIRDESTRQLREGNYEAAIKTLESGVARYPESPTLRAGLDSARAETISRLVAQAAQERAAGNFDEADKILRRALGLEPRNDRLLSLQADLAAERRAQKSLVEAQALAAAGKREEALRALAPGLRAAPRHPALVAMQRRLDADLRVDSDGGTRRLLAESRPISLDFRGAPLSTVLEAITRASGVNFILDRDVRQDGRVTVYLRSAPLDEAIELVTSAHQLARRIVDPQTVLIYPNTAEKQREHQEQVIRVFNLVSADAKTTAAMLRSVLRLKDPFVDEKANIVVLRESPEIVALAERLVALQDVGESEVMLEVEILEVKTSRLTELGINFPNSFSLTPLGPAGSTALTVSNLRDMNSSRVGVSVASLLVNLRRETGDFNILANPRIRAKNREKAHILIGDKVPVFTSTSGATGFVAESVSYIDVGLKLDVEPVISSDDDISIKLALEVSTIAREIRTSNGSLGYQIGTRNASTALRLRDGETQLLGGLISNEDRSSANKIPGLGDLPVAGRLFSSHRDDVQRTELVLAITPRIVRSTIRPDISQAQMWVGTELSTRLRSPPSRMATTHEAQSPLPTTGPSRSIAPSDAPAALTPVTASWEGPASVKLGETFAVTLNLASASPLHGLPLDIAFPAMNLDVVELVEGPFIKQDRTDTSFTHAVNAAAGRVAVGMLRSDPGGATGRGTALQIKFKAKAAGSADIALKSANPIGLSGALAMGALPVLHVEIK